MEEEGRQTKAMAEVEVVPAQKKVVGSSMMSGQFEPGAVPLWGQCRFGCST